MPTFAVHQYHVVIRTFHVEADSAEASAQLAHEIWPVLELVSQEDDDEVLDDVMVDPLLPNGKVDYNNAVSLRRAPGGAFQPIAPEPEEPTTIAGIIAAAAPEEHSRRSMMATAICLYEGMRAAAGNEFEQLLEQWRQSHYELCYGLGIVAERVHNARLKIAAFAELEGLHPHGEFDSEVSKEIGAQLATFLLPKRVCYDAPLCDTHVDNLLNDLLRKYYQDGLAAKPAAAEKFDEKLHELLPFTDIPFGD